MTNKASSGARQTVAGAHGRGRTASAHPTAGDRPASARLRRSAARHVLACALVGATLVPFAVPAATSAPEPLNSFPPVAPTQETAAPVPEVAPAPPAPPPPAPASAPAAVIEQPPAASPPASLPEPVASADYLSDGLLPPSLTDILIALFALVVAVFAWRLSAVTTRFAAATQGQLDASRRAVEASERAAAAASRSADAAEKSAMVMQDTAARRLRPYVTVKEFLQGPVKDDQGVVHGWVFQVMWQNSGATPTRGFRYWAALRQFDHDIPGDFDFAAPVLADFAGGELGSSSNVISGTLFVSQQDVAQLQAGTRKAVLYGKAEYHDVLGHDVNRETRFCVEIVLVSDAGGANATPFSFSYHPRHNAVT